jgi:hypothetical protein
MMEVRISTIKWNVHIGTHLDALALISSRGGCFQRLIQRSDERPNVSSGRYLERADETVPGRREFWSQ